MLMYREVKHTDLDRLGQYLSTYGDALSAHMGHIHSSMILEIDEVICGFTAFKLLTDTTARLVTLHIAPDHRGKQLGDGLVKALLNMADLRGITAVFAEDCQSGDQLSFMTAIGLKRLNDGERLAFTEVGPYPELEFVAHLPEYFLTACKSKRQKG